MSHKTIDARSLRFKPKRAPTMIVRCGGVINSQSPATGTGNVTTGEDDLLTYTLPANGLGVYGQTIRITAAGIFAANGNTKQVKLYFGATAIVTGTSYAYNDKTWQFVCIVQRKAAAVGVASGVYSTSDTTNGPAVHNRTALTVDNTAAVIIKVTGEATSTGDIIQDIMLVEILN